MQAKIFGSDSEVDDGQPSLYEVLIAQMMRALAGSFSGPNGIVAAGASAAGAVVRVNGHHVIPRYMCGAQQQFDLAALTRPEHDRLHAELYTFETAVRSAAIVYDLVFCKKKKLEMASPIAQTARTAPGRSAIVAALTVFYGSFGYGGSPWIALGPGQRTKLPIGGILAAEAPRYIISNHSSVGSCRNVKII